MPDKNNKQAGLGKSERFSEPRLKNYTYYPAKRSERKIALRPFIVLYTDNYLTLAKYLIVLTI